MTVSAHSHHISPCEIFASATTPQRKQAQRIDTGAALEVIEFLNNSPVDGLVLLGAAGQFPHFEIEEREKYVSFALRRCRKPAAVNVSHSTLEVTSYLAEHAASCGAAFLLVMPPYFYPYAEDRVEAYYRALRARVSSSVPLYLYRCPFFTSDFSCDAAHRLLSEGAYAGLIDCAAENNYLASLADTPGCKFLGNEAAWHAHRPHAQAVFSACAGIVPELIAGLERATLAQDSARQSYWEQELALLTSWLDRFPVPFAFMEAARLRGLPLDPDSSWLASAPLAEFRAWFKSWLPAILQAAKSS